MTIYGTPGGTPLNTSPFQGTAPGNAAVGVTLPPINPAPGYFAPGAPAQATQGQESTASAVSRAALPANALVTNFGLPRHAVGESLLASAASNGQSGAANIAANGGSLQPLQTGDGLGVGGSNVNAVNGAGDAQTELTMDMPATVPATGAGTAVNYHG
jgi:hypothetical protein